jgi:hypothetical protein
LLIVLNHGQWLLLKFGRFSIDDCLKDELLVRKDPTHQHFIALPPTRLLGFPGDCFRSCCQYEGIARFGVEVARLISLAQLGM